MIAHSPLDSINKLRPLQVLVIFCLKMLHTEKEKGLIYARFFLQICIKVVLDINHVSLYSSPLSSLWR